MYITDTQLAASDGASLVGFSQSGTGAQTRTVESKSRDILSDGDFGTLQNLVDAAEAQGKAVLLRGGQFGLAASLDLQAPSPPSTPPKFVNVRGIAGRSILLATSSMVNVVDVTETNEVSYSPLNLSGLQIDGGNLASGAGVSITKRRNYVLSDLLIRQTPTGVRLDRANSGVVRNVRTSAVDVGFHSVGSNHQTMHDSLARNSCADVGYKFEDAGLGDGNHANCMVNCLSQDCDRNLEINYDTSVDMFCPYLGENGTGYVIDNKGGVANIHGGILFFDAAAGHYLVHPAGDGLAGHGGVTRIKGTRIAAQALNGFSKLVHLDPSEVDLAKNGKVTFEDCDIFAPSAGGFLFNGDVIGEAPSPSRSYVPRYGRYYPVVQNGGHSAGFNGNAHWIQSTGASIIGFYASLTAPADWPMDRPLFVMLTYKSDKPLIIRTNSGVGAGNGNVLGAAPASADWATFGIFTALPVAGSDAFLEIYANSTATSGDRCELLKACLVGGDFVNPLGRSGVLSNLFYPA